MLRWLKNQIIEPAPAAPQPAPPVPSPVAAAVARQDRQGGDGDADAPADGEEGAPSGGGFLSGLVGLVAGVAVAEAILPSTDDDSRSGPGPAARGGEAGGGSFADGFGEGFADGGDDG